MFEHLEEYQIIVVTGPQRSGTTICARMIAHDLEITYVDEARFGVYNVEPAFLQARKWEPCVVQAPGLMRDYLYWALDPGVATVLMRRHVADIKASQNRVGWGVNELFSNAIIDRYFPSKFLKDPAGHVAQIQYDLWDNVGMADMSSNLFEIEYESLSEHSMWVNKEKRMNFGKRQYK